MKELLTYIVQNLVEKPDEVSVTEREANGETVFEVRVADGDMGTVSYTHLASMRPIAFSSTFAPESALASMPGIMPAISCKEPMPLSCWSWS